jgi:hypothetical protein
VTSELAKHRRAELNLDTLYYELERVVTGEGSCRAVA